MEESPKIRKKRLQKAKTPKVLKCCFPGCFKDSQSTNIWRLRYCVKHGVMNGTEDCDCRPPAEFFPFPRKKGDKQIWLQAVKKDKPADWVPSILDKICNEHFHDKKGPTLLHPYPVVTAEDVNIEEQNEPAIADRSHPGFAVPRPPVPQPLVLRPLVLPLPPIHLDPPLPLIRVAPPTASGDPGHPSMSRTKHRPSTNQSRPGFAVPQPPVPQPPVLQPLVLPLPPIHVAPSAASGHPAHPSTSGTKRRPSTSLRLSLLKRSFSARTSSEDSDTDSGPPHSKKQRSTSGFVKRLSMEASMKLPEKPENVKKSITSTPGEDSHPSPSHVIHGDVTDTECSIQEGPSVQDGETPLKELPSSGVSGEDNQSTSSSLMSSAAAKKKTAAKKTLSHKVSAQPQMLVKTNKGAQFYTGFPSAKILKIFYRLIKRDAEMLVSWNPSKRTPKIRGKYRTPSKRQGRSSKLDTFDKLIMVLMRFRLDLLEMDLADRFGVSVGTVSIILTSWTKFLARQLTCLVFVPDPEVTRANIPRNWKNTPSKHVTHVIDCSEIFIQTPADPVLQASTFSDYKHHNTLKFLISVTPNGLIQFISKAYTGRISDVAITAKSGFYDVLHDYEEVMADRGFTIAQNLAEYKCYLHVPPGRRGKVQFSAEEVKKTKRIANHRIIVEQVIGKLKIFRILSHELPIAFLSHISDILIICSAITNMWPPINRRIS